MPNVTGSRVDTSKSRSSRNLVKPMAIRRPRPIPRRTECSVWAPKGESNRKGAQIRRARRVAETEVQPPAAQEI